MCTVVQYIQQEEGKATEIDNLQHQSQHKVQF